MKPPPRCQRCGASLAHADRWGVLLPSAEFPIAIVLICTACLRALAAWLGVTK